MGVFEVFRRRKKEDEEVPALEAGVGHPEIDFGPDLGPMPRDDLRPNFTQIQPLQSSGVNDRDIQLILTKLELINRKLDDIDIKLKFIEKVAKESK